MLCTHLARRQPQPCIGPLQQVQRRSRRGRTQNGGTTHQGRLWGPSRRLSTSPAQGASVEPQSVVQRPPGKRQAPTARSPGCSSCGAHKMPRADRRCCSPQPPPGAIRGSIRISGSRRVEQAANQRAAAIWPTASRVRASSRRIACDGCSEAARRSPPLLTSAASWGEPRHRPHLRIMKHRMRQRLTLKRK